MKLSGYIFAMSLCGLLMMSASCGNTEKSEEVVAEETAAQMMDAKIAGRNAAKVFLSREWPDTMQLQNAILEAKSKQSEILQKYGKEKAAEFDTAFVRTLRDVRPDLAREIFN